MANVLENIGRGISKVSGAVVGGVLGTLTSIVVFNPVAVTIRRVKNLWKNISLSNLVLLLLAPVFEPINHILRIGFAQQTQAAWNSGFERGLTAPREILNYTYPRRDYIASLLILGLIALMVVGVFFPATFGIAAILPKLVASIGLTGLSTWALALLAGVSSLFLLSFMYGVISVAVIDGYGLNCESEKIIDSPNIFSRIIGMAIGAILGTVAAIIVYNPLAIIMTNAKKLWVNKNLENLMALLLSPIDLIYGILNSGFARQADYGWANGFKESRHVPKKVYDNSKFAKADIIAAWLITGLITIAVLAVLFPASFGMAALLPTVITSLHLTGLSTIALAVIAGLATFTVAAIAYWLGVKCYDNWPAPHHETDKPLKKIERTLERVADKIDESATKATQQLNKASKELLVKDDEPSCLQNLQANAKGCMGTLFSWLPKCCERRKSDSEEEHTLPLLTPAESLQLS